MTSAKAIAVLREKLGISQRELAERLGVTITQVSRYENGHSEPSRQVLKKLEQLAQGAGISHLKDFFGSQWRAMLVSRIEGLRSAGTERPIQLQELKTWATYLRGLAEYLKIIEQRWDAGTLDKEDRRYLGKVRRIAEAMEQDFQVYVEGRVPKQRPMTDDELASLNELMTERGKTK